MALLTTVGARDDNLVNLHFVLRAASGHVPELCASRSAIPAKTRKKILRTSAVLADRDPIFHGDTCISEAIQVLRFRSRPRVHQNLTLWFCVEVDTSSILAPRFALHVHEGQRLRNFHVLGNDEDIDVRGAEFLLQVGIGDGIVGFNETIDGLESTLSI